MFKDRFRNWHLYKNLQLDEALALLRIKAYRRAVDKSVHMEFSRYGRPISERRLERYLRDYPSLHARLQRHPSDEKMVDDLVERFLPPRGLTALGTPQRYLRNDEWSYLTESAIFSLQTFHDVDREWRIPGQGVSIDQLTQEIWTFNEFGVMAEMQADRDSAWRRVEKAHQLLGKEMKSNPGAFALNSLLLIRILLEKGEMLHFARQLANHLGQLSELVLGFQSPYHATFTGLARLMRTSCSTVQSSFGEFERRISEALGDVVVSRLRSGCRESVTSLSLLYRSARPSTKRAMKVAIRSIIPTVITSEEFVEVACALAGMRFRDSEYVNAHLLYKKATQICADTGANVGSLFEFLSCCIALRDCTEFEKVSARLEVWLVNSIYNPQFRRLYIYLRTTWRNIQRVLLFLTQDEGRTDAREVQTASRRIGTVMQKMEANRTTYESVN